MNFDSIKVYSASLFGFGTPSVGWFVDIGEPVMKILVLVGQFGVALATVIYISLKCRGVARRQKSDHPKRK